MSRLVLYTIYDKASDYPGEVVVRCWTIRGRLPVPEPDLFARCKTIEQARAEIPAAAACVGREAVDDHAIAETWINVEPEVETLC